MAILAHITYEFAVRVQRQCDGQGEPFGLNLFHIFDPLCLIIIIIIIIIIDNQKVATRPADNPMGMMARKVGWSNGVAHSAPRLSLPGKFVCCFFLLLLFLLVIIVFVIFYSHCRQVGVPLLSHSWTLLNARSWRCGDAWTSSLLCHAL